MVLSTKAIIKDKLNSVLSNAALIHLSAITSCSSLYKAFEHEREGRGATRGPSNLVEQDILRAMLVMSCAGFDSTIKQMIRDALPLLVNSNNTAQSQLEIFTERQFRRSDGDIVTNSKFLAKILASKYTYQIVVESYIKELTGDSLQSTDQLFKAVKALGIDVKILPLKKDILNEIFLVRNQIIHELDIDLQGRRKRRSRTRDKIIAWCDYLLDLTKSIIEQVDMLVPKALIHLRRPRRRAPIMISRHKLKVVDIFKQKDNKG